MSLFGFGRKTPDTPPAALTRAERDERDRKAALAEARAIAAHERAIEDELQARARATAEPLPLEVVRASLLAALDDAVLHGVTALRAQLDDAALGYAFDALVVDYRGQGDALRRAVGGFRPTPPLTAKDCEALTSALRGEVDAIVTATVQQAVDARTNATVRAGKWLREWARIQRHLPTDEALADRRDNAAFNAATADERSDDTVTVAPVVDVETGEHTRMFTIRYPIVPLED